MQISKRNELLQVIHESACARIPEVRDVVYMRSGGRNRSAQDFFEAGAGDAWAEPVGAHVAGGCCMGFSRVLHWERVRESPSKTGEQKNFLIFYTHFPPFGVPPKIPDNLLNPI